MKSRCPVNHLAGFIEGRYSRWKIQRTAHLNPPKRQEAASGKSCDQKATPPHPLSPIARRTHPRMPISSLRRLAQILQPWIPRIPLRRPRPAPLQKGPSRNRLSQTRLNRPHPSQNGTRPVNPSKPAAGMGKIFPRSRPHPTLALPRKRSSHPSNPPHALRGPNRLPIMGPSHLPPAFHAARCFRQPWIVTACPSRAESIK
jgi:hypothetical protein